MAYDEGHQGSGIASARFPARFGVGCEPPLKVVAKTKGPAAKKGWPVAAVRQQGVSPLPCCVACSVYAGDSCAVMGAGKYDLVTHGGTCHRVFAAGQTVFVDGEPADYAFSVLSGGVKLVKSLADGRTQITGVLLAGDRLSLPPRATYPFSGEALDGTVLCALSHGLLEELFQRDPLLRIGMIDSMYGDWAAAQDHMLLLGRKSALERLATFLVALMRRAEQAGTPPGPMFLPLRRDEIADYLGLTIATVSRSFSELRREGVIDLLGNTRFIVRVRAQLEAIAEGGDRRRSS